MLTFFFNIIGDEILQMLLSFPNDNSCSEIIQDIIYANSSSMDGRRFANDFISRSLFKELKLTEIILSSNLKEIRDWEFYSCTV